MVMKTKRNRIRTAVIALASFVMLLTVLPQIASALGLRQLADRLATTTSMSCGGGSGSGSGSSGSSSTCPKTGTVTGRVTVTGAPKGFTPAYTGAGACPDTGPPGQMCANPVYDLSVNGHYTLTLGKGKWVVAGFYENSGFGGVFLGSPMVVRVHTGVTDLLNLTVPYSPPASMKGTLTVRNVPANDPIFEIILQICPSFAPNPGGLACVSAYTNPALTSAPGSVSGSYSLAGLPPGNWTGYVGFCAENGCETNSYHGTAFTLTAGQETKINFGTNFLLRDQALLTGNIGVTGAPAGFSDELGVSACQSGTSNCQVAYEYGFPDSTYALVLNAGVWNVKGFYLASPYDNAVDGSSQTVVLRNRQVVNLDVSVPYQVLGTATGTITVKKLPSGVKVTSYSMLACPSAEPWNGGIPAPECVSEYSGPGGYGYGAADRGEVKSANPALRPPAGVTGLHAKTPYNVYSLPTLTSGVWLLYPGYQTAFGSYVDPNAKAVTVQSGQTTQHNVSVPYQQQAQGDVTGTVNVVGAPENIFETGVEACTAPPTSTSCSGERDAYSLEDGKYSLVLPPGTWWLSGFVDVYGPTSITRSTSQPKVASVVANTVIKKSFTVTVS
jgi:hypothetical protein